MPHTGRAHNGPWISTAVQKTTPISAPASASASAFMACSGFRCRTAKYQIDAAKLMKNKKNVSIAEGKW